MAMLASIGCNDPGGQNMFATDSGYLLYAQDVIVTPGTEVSLKAKLRGGPLLTGKNLTQIRFYIGGAFVNSALTDENGDCSLKFTPRQTGDYIFTVEVDPIGFDDKAPAPVKLLLACRDGGEPIIVVDLDKTLVADGFDKVLLSKAEPMADSVTVMTTLAKTNTIVYLTHRPDLLGPKSKNWLAENKYPTGPVLLSNADQFAEGSEAFKTKMLKELKDNFRNANIGIGDKISDARAYQANSITPYLILSIAPDASSFSLKRLAASLNDLDDRVQVVTSWQQIAEGILQSKDFPRRAAQLEILRRANGG